MKRAPINKANVELLTAAVIAETIKLNGTEFPEPWLAQALNQDWPAQVVKKLSRSGTRTIRDYMGNYVPLQIACEKAGIKTPEQLHQFFREQSEAPDA